MLIFLIHLIPDFIKMNQSNPFVQTIKSIKSYGVSHKCFNRPFIMCV